MRRKHGSDKKKSSMIHYIFATGIAKISSTYLKLTQRKTKQNHLSWIIYCFFKIIHELQEYRAISVPELIWGLPANSPPWDFHKGNTLWFNSSLKNIPAWDVIFPEVAHCKILKINVRHCTKTYSSSKTSSYGYPSCIV